MNALENVALPLMFRGEAPKVRIKKADRMLDMVGLSRHKKHMPEPDVRRSAAESGRGEGR